MSREILSRTPPPNLTEIDCANIYPTETDADLETIGDVYDNRDGWREAAKTCRAESQAWRAWALPEG